MVLRRRGREEGVSVLRVLLGFLRVFCGGFCVFFLLGFFLCFFLVDLRGCLA